MLGKDLSIHTVKLWKCERNIQTDLTEKSQNDRERRQKSSNHQNQSKNHLSLSLSLDLK